MKTLFALLSLLMIQDPIPQPIVLECMSTTTPVIKAKMEWDRYPFDALRMFIVDAPLPTNTDIVPPVITSVVYYGGKNVLSGTIKTMTGTTSLTVGAIDDVEIVGWSLILDGYQIATGAKGKSPMALPLGIRWNEVSESGTHDFKLSVWDSAKNVSIVTWKMTKS